MTESSELKKKPWYTKWWGIILAIIFWGISVPYLIWVKTKWNKALKIVLSLVLFLLWLFFVNLAEPDPSPLPENQPQANQVETVTEARLNEPEVSQEEPKTIEKFDITVTSQIVKRVDGKCRYFFDVRNQDTKDFGGSVLISVYSDSIKSPLSSITFTARNPISPSLGHSVSLDASTCPPSIHGADGMTRYTYEVNIENSIVTKGEGRLTEKFEDLDAYNF